LIVGILLTLLWQAKSVGASPGLNNFQGTLEGRVAALEEMLEHFSREGDDIFITGANLHVRNDTGTTDGTPDGLGNVIIGYNELRGTDDDRSGSHMLVVGKELNYSSFGGLVVGQHNETSGWFSTVSGGENNTASGSFSTVSGGFANTASGNTATVSGGADNTASGGPVSTVSGGQDNVASGLAATVSGGGNNTASGDTASVSGGDSNTASGPSSTISGGQDNVASGTRSSVSGGRGNTAGAPFSSVSGGSTNMASGQFSTVSGGRNNTASLEQLHVPSPEAGSITVDDLIGIWQAESVVTQFYEDGTFRAANSVNLLESLPVAEGEFQFDGNEITLITSEESLNCEGLIGSYQVQLTEQGELQFELQEDPCNSRHYNFTNEPWSRNSP
jgi:hypothetical protein